MLHCYFATVWIQNSGGIATTSTLPTLHHWICQGWDCKNVGSILQQEPHCLDEQQRQCNRLMKNKAKWTPPCYSATPLQTRREHLISELRATRYTATMLQTEKKAQTKNTPPCYSATPLQTRREHLISEQRATRYTATMLQTEKKLRPKTHLLATALLRYRPDVNT